MALAYVVVDLATVPWGEGTTVITAVNAILNEMLTAPGVDDETRANLAECIDVEAVVASAVATADDLDTFLAYLPTGVSRAAGHHGVCFGGDGTLLAYGSLSACGDGKAGAFLCE